jgi:dTDP-4-dehydrorhamnose 3,5-epimerase
MWTASRIVSTPVQGCALIEQQIIEDERGWFSRVFSSESDGPFPFRFLHDVNNSFFKIAGTLRGLHWQEGPSGEAKVVRCIRGEVLDIVADVRSHSPTFGRIGQIRLSSSTPAVVYVPSGCAHGVISLVDQSEIIYWTDAPYDPGNQRGVRHDDPLFQVQLPIAVAVISDADRCWPDFGSMVD